MSFRIVLVDSEEERKHLFPLVATRPVSNLRIGFLTIDEKWTKLFNTLVSCLTVSYLSIKYTVDSGINTVSNDVIYIKANVLPSISLFSKIQSLKINQLLLDNEGGWIAFRVANFVTDIQSSISSLDSFNFKEDLYKIVYPEHIFMYNSEQIQFDLRYCLKLSKTSVFPKGNSYVGDNFFIAEGNDLQNITLDSSLGPIYIGKSVVIEPGVMIKGPVSIGDFSRIKSGAVLYPNVTVGPGCTVAGELSNTVIWGNSAKGHDGYLGCAVIGEGVNLGAGTNNSNLRNDWATVRLYDYDSDDFRNTGLQKCGVIIGDNSMLAIQSKINTGTVIGVGVQIAFSKFIPKFVPDFTWLTDDKVESYIFDRFLNTMSRILSSKNKKLDEYDKIILRFIYEKTENLRNKIINTK